MWKSMWHAVAERKWLAFLVAGLLLIAISVVSSVTWKDGGSIKIGSTWCGALGGFVCLGASILFARRESQHWSGRKPIAKIISPREGDKCPETTPFSGTFKGKVCPGWEVWLIRRFTATGPYYPDVAVRLTTNNSDKTTSWTAPGFVGGAVGDERYFELWAVGPETLLFFKEWERVRKSYFQLRGAYFKVRDDDKNGWPLEGLKETFSGMIHLDTVRVYRK